MAGNLGRKRNSPVGTIEKFHSSLQDLSFVRSSIPTDKSVGCYQTFLRNYKDFFKSPAVPSPLRDAGSLPSSLELRRTSGTVPSFRDRLLLQVTIQCWVAHPSSHLGVLIARHAHPQTKKFGGATPGLSRSRSSAFIVRRGGQSGYEG